MKKMRFFSMMCVIALAIGSFTGCNKFENGFYNGNGGPGGTGGSGSTGGTGGTGSTGSTVAEYVDLGLPSGTKWNSVNETGGHAGFFTYDEAMNAFGNNLPTKEQFNELRVYCTWVWQVNGYKVTGPNGNFIVLQAAGERGCDGFVDDIGFDGNYWSSTPKDWEDAWNLNFDSHEVEVDDDDRCEGHSVRLVQNL